MRPEELLNWRLDMEGRLLPDLYPLCARMRKLKYAELLRPHELRLVRCDL